MMLLMFFFVCVAHSLMLKDRLDVKHSTTTCFLVNVLNGTPKIVNCTEVASLHCVIAYLLGGPGGSIQIST